MSTDSHPEAKQRIVSLAPSVTSILVAIGARRRLVAVSRWCRAVADVGGLPELGDAWQMEPDSLRRVRPTLIIGSVPYRPATLGKILEWPAPFVATNPRTLADIFAEIGLLGALVGRQAAATRLVQRMRRDFRRIARRARRVTNRPRIYAEAWPHPRISSPPWVAEMVEIAGGRMVVAPGRRISDDQVVRARPEVIVLAWTAAGDRSRPDQILRNSAWQSVPAVKTGRVAVVADHWLNTPGPPLVKGVELLFRVLHPELAGSKSIGGAGVQTDDEPAVRGIP